MRFAILAAKNLTANPRQKERICEILQVEPNKVFRAIVKQYMLTDGHGTLFEETEQEKLDKETLIALKKIITTEVPDAELMLFGNRAKGAYDVQSDWDMLILTTNDTRRNQLLNNYLFKEPAKVSRRSKAEPQPL